MKHSMIQSELIVFQYEYEYLTGEDLNYKLTTVEQAKFDCFPWNKFFNKGLKEKDKRKDF